MLSHSIGRLRAIGMLEGVSFLVLLGVAMPLKYLAGMPAAVKIVGWVHGILFVALCWTLAEVQREAVAQPDNQAEPQGNNQADAGREQASETEAEAVAALKDLGAQIKLNDNGEATTVSFFTTDPRIQRAHRTPITNRELEHLKALTSLGTLNLMQTTGVTDESLVHLTGLLRLRTLHLLGTQVTGSGLAPLKGLTSLPSFPWATAISPTRTSMG